MEDGIVIGPVSEQKNTKDFNQKKQHVEEGGKVNNIPEGKNPDLCAFVLFASNTDDARRVGLNYEKQDSVDKNIIKAFTFIIPFDFEGDIRDLVKDEVKLQSGFDVSHEHIEYLDKSFVGETSGNHCHHFGITVDKRMQMPKTSKSPKIIESSHFWAMNEEIKDLQDWMAQLTCIKRYTSKMNSILISNNGQKNK
jgi:hypothetical protein